MMRPLQLTLRRTFSGFWTALQMPSLFIHNYKLEFVHEFVYLGSTITDNLSIDSELIKRIGKAAMTLSSLTN